jgi:predicted Zn-dependent protease
MKRFGKLCLASLMIFGVAQNINANDNTSFRARSNINIEESPYTQSDIQAEIVFGRELASKLTGRYNLYKDVNLNKYINKVGKNIARFSTRPELDFKFAVLDSQEINAFACPGGYIFVTLGAIKKMKNESELAGVLAHEIIHVSQRHIVKELEIRGKDSDSFTSLLSASGTNAVKAMSKMVDGAFDTLLNSGLKDFKYEYEADKLGTFLIYNTGYDTSSLHVYLQRISADTKHLKVVSKTHPTFDSRIDKLKKVNKVNHLSDEQLKQLKKRFEKNVKL